MIAVQITARSAVLRAGLEAIVRSNRDFALADATAADVYLVAAQQLTEEVESSPVPVVWLTELSEAAGLGPIHRTSVRAILSPEATPEEITAAIFAAAAGLVAFEPAALDHILAPTRQPVHMDEPLTPREIEVLTMMADGLSNKIIAQRLSISEHTAKFHVGQILAKLDAGSRTEAVTQGIRRGLILL